MSFVMAALDNIVYPLLWFECDMSPQAPLLNAWLPAAGVGLRVITPVTKPT